MYRKSMEKISLVIPVHNENDNLEWHHEKIKKTLKKLKHEIIYIDDGSTDSSLAILKKLAANDASTFYVSFTKNFGKEAAISAGLQKASGDAAFILDSDGQHPIELLPEFIAKWQDGFDVVMGVRKSNQGEGIVKSVGSKLFYTLLRVIDNDQGAIRGATDFCLIDRQVINQYNQLTERNRVARHLIEWLGFNRATIPFHAHARHAGNAAYSYTKLVKLAIDGAIKHSTKPLKLIGALGLLISVLSLLLMAFLLIENYVFLDPLKLGVSGTALLAIFLSFLVGVVLTCQGLLALYIENVYYETQNRPLYIVREEK